MKLMPFAPAIAEQSLRASPALLAVGHEYHARVETVGRGFPVNNPPGSVAVMVWPTCAVPEMVGAAATAGVPNVVTELEAADSAPDPMAFKARTITRYAVFGDNPVISKLLVRSGSATQAE